MAASSSLASTRRGGGTPSGFLTPSNLGLLIDLYELTMAAAYLKHGIVEDSTFEIFCRRLPPHRSFLIAAGLEQAVEYLQRVRFAEDQLEYLRGLPVFSGAGDSFFDYLGKFEFRGDIWAMPEGTPFFPQEPILRVKAPAPDAQLLETFLLSILSYQTMVASKAARLTLAAGSREVIDFGTRRAHGPQAGLLAARASFIGGCLGTSNVLAGQQWGIPVLGTMAHSWVMQFDSEADAFRSFREIFPEHTIMLLDTYDTIQAAQLVAQIKARIPGVRLDSGDLCELVPQVRRILDEAGHVETRIVASGDLNEEKIQEIARLGLPVDSFGVGTDLVISSDAPSVNLVYKLAERIASGKRIPTMKVSTDKATYPFSKQVVRFMKNDRYVADRIIIDTEPAPAETLLQQVIAGGRQLSTLPALKQIQEYTRRQMARLPEGVTRLQNPESYPVEFSPRLRDEFSQFRDRLA
ncbi:MAG: nicotinate phosphoribosyltransferase [Acidobacteria bacterium]|nr:nicotinate phosphoribosyltransferase [Acidobacteriota bacterium]